MGKTDYDELNAMLASITEGIPYTMTNLANASALLNSSLRDINWVGFYTIKDNQLVLGPFQGKVACTIIQMGKGVCGTAAATDSTQLVPDVHKFHGHIACDSASNSEIVIPMHRRINFSLSYRFGKLKASVKKTEHSIDNDDVVGGITKGN